MHIQNYQQKKCSERNNLYKILRKSTQNCCQPQSWDDYLCSPGRTYSLYFHGITYCKKSEKCNEIQSCVKWAWFHFSIIRFWISRLYSIHLSQRQRKFTAFNCNSIVVFTTYWKFWCCCIHCLFGINEYQWFVYTHAFPFILTWCYLIVSNTWITFPLTQCTIH